MPENEKQAFSSMPNYRSVLALDGESIYDQLDFTMARVPVSAKEGILKHVMVLAPPVPKRPEQAFLLKTQPRN